MGSVLCTNTLFLREINCQQPSSYESRQHRALLLCTRAPSVLERLRVCDPPCLDLTHMGAERQHHQIVCGVAPAVNAFIEQFIP